MSNKILLSILSGEKIKNDFMHAVDVFEKGKQLATYSEFEVMGKPDLKKLCENMKNALEANNQNVVFIGVNSVNGKRPKSPLVYIKPDVQTISTGRRFFRFKDWLENAGYKVKTTEWMTVLSVSY